MPTRNVVLTPHHEEMIAALVASGRYQNASEVLREGLRLVEQRDAHEAEKLKALRKAARLGFSDVDQAPRLSGPGIEKAVRALGRQAHKHR